ncbi:MAG: O-antigen ligase family protein [Blastochloris viridis]|uniref:O-antigen ligase family protein n=1 Tax=Blastochloris viridis TaxID=1079 RepID=A0A6N4R2S4_BLAVI|nr:MAG: O-antigen ligase family protein [Blastochloris viridis]
MTPVIPALIGLSLPAMILTNAFTYGLAVLGMLLAFSLPQVRDGKAIRETLAGLVRSPIAWAVAALLLSLYIGTLTGIRPEYSVKHWVRLVLMAVIAGVMYHVFRTAKLENKILAWLITGIQASYIIAFAIAAAEPWALPLGYYGDKPWTETHLRFFSSLLAVVLPFCWMVWLKPAANGVINLRDKAQMNGMLWVCSSLVFVLLCEGRSGWVGVIASALVWLVMMSRYHKLRLPRFDVMALLAAGTLAVSGITYILLYGMTSIKERIGVTIPDRGLGGGRLDIWQLSWNHVFDQPFFGIGVNGFRFIPGADYHPHNFVLQIWLEGGFVSLMATFVLIGVMAYALFKKSKADGMGVAGLAALAGFVVCALTNKSIFNLEWLVVLVITMPLALASRPLRAAVAAPAKIEQSAKSKVKPVAKAKKPAGKKGRK